MRLIEGTLTSLGQRGYHRSTVRAIAKTAGVTAGLVNHHFNGKQELMLNAYRHFKSNFLNLVLTDASKAGPDPVKRLEAFTRSFFRTDAAQGETMRIWATLVELAIRDPAVASEQVVLHERWLREIRGCVTGIYAARGERLSPDGAQKLSLSINAIIAGAWLECCLNPSTMNSGAAAEISLEMIGNRIGVSFSNDD